MYLDKSMAFMVAKSARAEGTADTVSPDKVAADAPPISTALAGRVLGTCIKESSFQ